MNGCTSRRDFLKESALGTAGLVVLGSHVLGAEAPSNKLNIAAVGVGGRGGGNIGGCGSENFVALCDVNSKALEGGQKRFPNAKAYADWRKMFDDAKDFDAVICSTTDHTHALVSNNALRLGKHVYVEKPIGHSVHEAAVLRETYLKANGKLATQQGTQIHADQNYRRVVELVRAGAIGPVKEAHVWCGRRGPNPQPPAPDPNAKPPEWLNWDLWLGPAPDRPYHRSYHEGGCMGWEQWWDFGNGCLGDMGSHLIDLAYWALDLRFPITAEAEGDPPCGDPKTKHSYPHWLKCRWDHPAVGDRPPVKLFWYDGGQKPPPPPDDDLKGWGQAIMFVGEKGWLIADYGRKVLLPKEQFKDFKPPEPTIPNSVGHYREWLNGCKTGSPTLCNFDYAGLLIMNNLLGSVAYRVGKKLEWDAEALKATNCPEAAPFIKRPYRAGWSL
ncbi:MAG: twin-arginine translocation signal domain-containing protein [Planctomycetes bacterium]|nr:twin-arginine translocation signal domain-containing protein [Planctomycetota bacterium]